MDDWIGEDNPVRAVDVFVDALDLMQLGFERAQPADTGRPAYHPSTLLKIYMYEYLNQVQSIRRLEREAQRNVDMAMQTQDTISQPVTVLADRGYFNGNEILRCDEAGIVPLVPKPQTSNNKAAGLFDKNDFVYDETDDTYRCPAGERAIYRMTVVENAQTLRSTGPRPVGDARSSRSALPANIGGSRVGSTRRCSSGCRRV